MSHEVEQVEKRTGLFNYFKESFMELKKLYGLIVQKPCA